MTEQQGWLGVPGERVFGTASVSVDLAGGSCVVSALRAYRRAATGQTRERMMLGTLEEIEAAWHIQRQQRQDYAQDAARALEFAARSIANYPRQD